jgi:transcription factor SPT20
MRRLTILNFVVLSESHILRKFKGCAPSLIVHLHPTHFRFDQQDGSFSYHSEMRVFIEHLAKGTIPHDMVEEFRKSDVKFYDGWLIVRVIDKRTAAKDAAASGTGSDDEKPFSINNYNEYITPSPYAPYPTKEQSMIKSPRIKQESSDNKSDPKSDDTVEVAPKSTKPQPKIYHVALRPTILSRHMDLVMDAMQPDPKSLNRKSSQANANNRAGGSGAPQTPISGMPPTPSAEKGPPFKKQKLKIDPKDMLEYEARVVNATAPPLFLDLVDNLEESEDLLHRLRDPFHEQRPPSPRSRKRTVAELAADDAHAKEQERFMLVMDERTAGTNGAANAGAVDGQAAAALFQPRFEKFNALDNIKREIAERKQREKDRQLQEDENRRGQQERLQEEEKKRLMMARTQEARLLRARQAEMAAALAAQQSQPSQPTPRPPSSQVNGIPPNMRNQMVPGGSPIIRQGTPHAASSPVVTSAAQGGVPMAVSSSQQGHGSPARPGSAVPHGHPAASMARAPSQQGPSRNGTPQIPHGTPAQRNATPILRQGTPSQAGTHASPHGATPQMMPAGMMPGLQSQMPNGMHRQLNPQQMAELQRRQAMQQQAQQAAMQQGMMNGAPQVSAAQVAQMQAQQAQAQANREAAIRQQRQQQAMQSQQGTPQTQHMSPNPNQNQKMYNQSVAEAMKAQLQNIQQGQAQGSPAPTHMTPQQQQAQIAHMQAAQQQRMMQQAQAQAQGQMMGQGMPNPQQQQPERVPMDPNTQRLFQQAFQQYHARFAAQAAAKYGGNQQMLQPQDLHQIKLTAQKYATQHVQKQRQQQMGGQMHPMQAAQMQHLQARQLAAQQQQQAGGHGGMSNGMMGMQNMQQQGQVNPNMTQLLQHQQAEQMQHIHMQQAAQMMQQQQHQQQQQQNMQFGQR